MSVDNRTELEPRRGRIVGNAEDAPAHLEHCSR
jgi:hypothetical protein